MIFKTFKCYFTIGINIFYIFKLISYELWIEISDFPLPFCYKFSFTEKTTLFLHVC